MSGNRELDAFLAEHLFGGAHVGLKAIVSKPDEDGFQVTKCPKCRKEWPVAMDNGVVSDPVRVRDHMAYGTGDIPNFSSDSTACALVKAKLYVQGVCYGIFHVPSGWVRVTPINQRLDSENRRCWMESGTSHSTRGQSFTACDAETEETAICLFAKALIEARVLK